MYVGVRDMTLNHAGYGTVAEGLADLDLRAVELAVARDLGILGPDTGFREPRPAPVRPQDCAALREQYGRRGIRVSGLLLANNFNAVDIAAETRWVAEAVRIAAILGADAVRIDAAMTGQQEMPLRRRIDTYASAVSSVLEATGDTAVPLAIENHGVQGNDPEWLQGVLDAVASPRLGVTLDTANFYWAGLPLDEVYAAIEQFASHVKLTHCKNICFEADRRNARREAGWGYGEHVCPIPDGDLDHLRIARVLWEAGFRGGLVIEDESLSKFESDERRRQLRRDADHLAQVAETVGGARHPAAGREAESVY